MRQLKIVKKLTKRTQSLDRYMSEISKEKLLTSEEEISLAVRIKAGDEVALEKLIRANLRFVISVAKQYEYSGVDLDDLISEGNVGLIKAAKRFDETRGFKFISYAVWWIRQSILEHIGNTKDIIRKPNNINTTQIKINNYKDKFISEHGYTPSDNDILRELDLPESYKYTVLNSYTKARSLSVEIGHDTNVFLSDTLEDKNTVTYEELMNTEHLNKALITAIDIIPDPRIKYILKKYYNLGNENTVDVNLSDIGKELGLTRERVRQLRDKGLRSLKTGPSGRVLNKFL